MGAAVETQGMEARMSIRLIAYISAAALAAVVLAYGPAGGRGVRQNAGHVRRRSMPPS